MGNNMKSKLNINIKLDKKKTNSVTLLALSSFILIFGLFTSKELFGFFLYQNRVISAQKSSIANILGDQQVANNVENSYKNFVNQPSNIIGGSSSGTTPNSGNNAKIILDALPETYDFPALISSTQALINLSGVTIQSLTGTDQSLSLIQSTQPTPIPITFSVSGSYSSIQNFLSVLNRSVSPIDILSIDMSGTDANLNVTVTAQMYYYNPQSGLSTSEVTVQ
jgi:hypothetical protein